MTPATKGDAEAKRVHHQFVPGAGYLDHGAPPALPLGAHGDKNCAPLAGTKTGSRHLMKPAGGGKPVVMVWIAAEAAWASQRPGKGNRLAWPAAYLMRAGWEYDKPEPSGPVVKAKK
jgi:hypothetical protein